MEGDNAFLYKLVVVSDSHRSIARLNEILPVINAADYFIFCGDGVQDVMAIRGSITVPIVCVRGNNDFGTAVGETAVTSFGNTRAMITHGHRFDVRKGLKLLYVTAVSDKCDMVFFGHTHTFTDKKVQGVRFINPGALCMGSYALVAGDGNDFAVKQCFV